MLEVHETPAPGETVRLQHWVYGASPEKGYGTKAESYDLNPPLYVRHLAGHMTPVRVEKTSSGSTLIDARMIHPVPSTGEVILSLLGRGVADEYNRPTIATHSVVIPERLLRSGLLSYSQVERALQEFDRQFPTASGKIPPLEVFLRSEEDARAPPGQGIKRLISKAAADTLATRLVSDPHGRTLVLCRGSTNQMRNELLFDLVELLTAGGEIPLFTAISDAPTLSAMNHFRVAISARGVRADATWTLLDASMDKAALPTLRRREAMYERVAQAFA